MLWAVGVLASHVELKQGWAWGVPRCFAPILCWQDSRSRSRHHPGFRCVLHWVRLGGTAGAWVGSDGRATSGGCLGLMRAREVGLTEVSGRLEWPDRAPVCAVRVEGDHEQWSSPAPPPPGSIPATPPAPGRRSGCRSPTA